MTPEQREAVIERMAAAMWDRSLPPGPRDWAHFKANWREHADPHIARAVVALEALLDDHVVIPKDDVTAVQAFLDAYDAHMISSVSRRTFGPMVEARSALFTRWTRTPGSGRRLKRAA